MKRRIIKKMLHNAAIKVTTEVYDFLIYAHIPDEPYYEPGGVILIFSKPNKMFRKKIIWGNKILKFVTEYETQR